MAGTQKRMDDVLNWLHKGYPHGVPEKDYFALLALLTRTLTEEEVVLSTRSLLRENQPDTPITELEIQRAIREVAEKEPNPEEVYQVAARLASVGWPLAVPAN